MVGAFEPNFWVATPRTQQYLQDLIEALDTTVRLEEYKTGEREGQLKGPVQLGRMITPAPVRQATRGINEATSNSTKSSAGLPELPSLPDLPELPELPKL